MKEKMQSGDIKRIRVGIRVNTHPPPPAPVSFETRLYFRVVRNTVSIEEWLTPMHWSKPWFISISSASLSSLEVMAISSSAANSTTLESSSLIEFTALKTEAIASGCLDALSDTPASRAFVFLPTLVSVMSILTGFLDLRFVNSPFLNLIMLPNIHTEDLVNQNKSGELIRGNWDSDGLMHSRKLLKFAPFAKVPWHLRLTRFFG